jgi:hypothetical protein
LNGFTTFLDVQITAPEAVEKFILNCSFSGSGCGNQRRLFSRRKLSKLARLLFSHFWIKKAQPFVLILLSHLRRARSALEVNFIRDFCCADGAIPVAS